VQFAAGDASGPRVASFVGVRHASAPILVALTLGFAPDVAKAADADEATSPSPPDPQRSEAEALFDEGLRHAQRGRWGEAVRAYERSLELYFSAKTLYSLGVAQSRSGNEVEALATMDQFLALPRDPRLDAFREAAIEERERLRTRVATVTLDVPRGAEVRVDGETVRRPQGSPAWVHQLMPGPHRVEMHSEAGTTTMHLELRPGEQRSLRLRALEADDVAPPEASSTVQIAGWSLLGVGGTFGLASLGTGAASLAKADGAIDGTSTADEARRLAVATDVLVVIGLASAATGGGLLLASDLGDDSDVALGLDGLTMTF